GAGRARQSFDTAHSSLSVQAHHLYGHQGHLLRMLGAGDGLLEIVVEAQIQLDDALSPTKRRLSACSRSRGVGSRKLSDDETSELHVPVPTGAVVLPLDCVGPGVSVADEDLGIARPGLR